MKPSREQIEHFLKYFFECEYNHRNASVLEVAKSYYLSKQEAKEVINALVRSGLVEMAVESPILSVAGREYAAQVVRAHRLYETYLARSTGLKAAEWHRRANQKEHELNKDDVAKLAHELGNPRFDPHGDPIPTETGQVGEKAGVSLCECGVGSILMVSHVEDEPEEVFRELSAKGIALGVTLRCLENKDGAVEIKLEGVQFNLSSKVARNVTVQLIADSEGYDPEIERLDVLKQGEKAKIIGLSPSCVGAERNRLLDLGIVPKTTIEAEIVTSPKSPVAYRIRGALIALRYEQSQKILIKREAS